MRRREREERESAGEKDGTGTAVPWGKGGAGQTAPGQIRPSGGADPALGGAGQSRPSGGASPAGERLGGALPVHPAATPHRTRPLRGEGGSFK